jgi:predicted dehydrogenase
MTEPDHPYVDAWWPPGFPLGWADLFVHLVHDFTSAIATGRPFGPEGATFQDGYRAAVICDAIAASGANGGERVAIEY